MAATTTLLLALIGGLAVAVAVVAATLAWVVLRLRSWPIARLARQVEELARRFEELEAASARANAPATTRRDPRADPVVSRPIPAHLRFQNGSLRADTPASLAPGPTLISVPTLAPPATKAAGVAATSEELERRFGAIWELADAGTSPDAIARRCGQPIGQVELILALRRNLAANSGA